MNTSSSDYAFVRRWLDEALRDSDVPWWEWQVETNTVKIGPRKATMLGYDPDAFTGGGYQSFTNLLHPDDYERTMEAMRRLLEGRSPIYQVDYRIRAADGNYRWYMDRGTFVSGSASTQSKRMRGVVIDLGGAFGSGPFEEEQDFLPRVRSVISTVAVPAATVTLCAVCGRVKNDSGGLDWHEVSRELLETLDVEVSHGMCESCIRALYPDYAEHIISAMEDGGAPPE